MGPGYWSARCSHRVLLGLWSVAMPGQWSVLLKKDVEHDVRVRFLLSWDTRLDSDGDVVSGRWASESRTAQSRDIIHPVSLQAPFRAGLSNFVSWWLAVKGFEASLRLQAVPNVALLK